MRRTLRRFAFAIVLGGVIAILLMALLPFFEKSAFFEDIRKHLLRATSRELATLFFSFISFTAAIIGYFNNRELRDDVKETRARLQAEVVQNVRVRAEFEEKNNTLASRQVDVERREAEVEEYKTARSNLLDSLRQSDADLLLSYGNKAEPYVNYNERIARRDPFILLIANNKGGVGKSTVSLNLMAHLDQVRANNAKRGLLIDMDYQASSSYILTALIESGDRRSRVQQLLEQGFDPQHIFQLITPLSSVLPHTDLVSAFYDLARAEERLMMEWLLRVTDDDIRYRLGRVLLSETFVARYDRVVIDAPPRLTVGTVNALCACTHVIVPTAFTPISVEPVRTFLELVRAIKDRFNPSMNMVGVVETFVPAGNVPDYIVQRRNRARLTVSEALRDNFPEAKILKTEIPRMNGLMVEGLPYQTDHNVRAIFEGLWNEINGRVT